MELEIVVPLILVGVAISIGLTSWHLTRRDFRRRFATRITIAPEEALSAFQDENASALIGLWVKLETVLGVPRGTLRLTDRFAQELRANPRWALAQPSGEVLEDLQKHFPCERIQVESVRDYCVYALRLRETTRGDVDLARQILG